MSHSLGGAIVDALRDTWNARGTADVAAIDAALSLEMGADSARDMVAHLEHVIRVFDRWCEHAVHDSSESGALREVLRVSDTRQVGTRNTSGGAFDRGAIDAVVV